MNNKQTDLAALADGQLLYQQRQLLRLAALAELAARNGYDLLKPWGADVHSRLAAIEEEYLRRHPESREKRLQDFFAAAERTIDDYNRERIGDRDRAGNPLELFVEYNRPAPGQKLITRRRCSDGGKWEEAQPMDEVDIHLAALESSLDVLSEAEQIAPVQRI